LNVRQHRILSRVLEQMPEPALRLEVFRHRSETVGDVRMPNYAVDGL
jgi:hypothetical protein